MTQNRVLLCFLAALLLAGCDSDKFLGYKYEADQVSNTVVITGTIFNIFTRQPVLGASIDAEGQMTTSAFSGQYRLTYVLRGDEQFDRPIAVSVSAENYFSLDTSLVIYPRDNVLNVQLVYGAPIIQDSFLEDSICTAQVFDYQGVDDLDSVLTLGYYVDVDGETDSTYSFPMTRISAADPNTGIFQSVLPDSIGTLGLVRANYFISAVDKAGFEDFRAFRF